MAHARASRIAREVDMLRLNPPAGISAWVVQPEEADGSLRLEAAVSPPPGTPYTGGRFCLEVRLSKQYPFEAPSVRFVTKIFHPNVDEQGRICLDSLKLPPNGAWRPSLNMVQVLSQIQILMSEPGLGDPLMPNIAELYQSDYQQFRSTAADWTARYAMPSTLKSATLEAPPTASAPPAAPPATALRERKVNDGAPPQNKKAKPETEPDETSSSSSSSSAASSESDSSEVDDAA